MIGKITRLFFYDFQLSALLMCIQYLCAHEGITTLRAVTSKIGNYGTADRAGYAREAFKTDISALYRPCNEFVPHDAGTDRYHRSITPILESDARYAHCDN